MSINLYLYLYLGFIINRKFKKTLHLILVLKFIVLNMFILIVFHHLDLTLVITPGYNIYIFNYHKKLKKLKLNISLKYNYLKT